MTRLIPFAILAPDKYHQTNILTKEGKVLRIKLLVRPLKQVVFIVKIVAPPSQGTEQAPDVDEVLEQLEQQLDQEPEDKNALKGGVIDLAVSLARFLREAEIIPVVADYETNDGKHISTLLLDETDAIMVESWFRETFGCDE